MRAILAAITGALKGLAWLFETAINTVIGFPGILWESMVRAAGGGQVADADEPRQAADRAVNAAKTAATAATLEKMATGHYLELAAELMEACADRLEGLPIKCGKLDNKVIDYVKALSPGEANILAHTAPEKLAGYLRGEVVRIPGVRLLTEVLSGQQNAAGKTPTASVKDTRMTGRVAANRARRAPALEEEGELELAY